MLAMFDFDGGDGGVHHQGNVTLNMSQDQQPHHCIFFKYAEDCHLNILLCIFIYKLKSLYILMLE